MQFGAKRMSSENPFPGFRDRLAALIGQEEPFLWARRAGIPSSTFDRVWNNGQVPKAESLLRIARFAGVSVDWLLTGDLQARPESAQEGKSRTDAEFDADLYGRVLEAISAVYKEMNWGISLRQLGAEAAQIADDISAEGLAPDEKPPAVKAAAAMLRRKLRDAAADPTAEASTKGRA